MLRFRSTCLVMSMMMVILGICAFGVAIAADTIAAHAPLAASPAPAAAADFLRDTVFPVLTSFVLGVFTLFMNRMGQKFKIQALSDKNSFVFKLAAQGVALAEEKAAQLVGSKAALTGSDKLDIAVAHVLAYAPKLTAAQAQNIVHSVLAQIPGAGATGEGVTLLPQEGGYSIPVPSAEELLGPAGPTLQTGLTPAAPTPVPVPAA
jgi:hypothetical protein